MTAEQWEKTRASWDAGVPVDYRCRVVLMAFGGRRTHRRRWSGPVVAAITAQVEALEAPFMKELGGEAKP